MFFSLLRSSFLHTASSYCLPSFISPCRTPSNISWRAHLVVRHSLSFYLLTNVLISPSLLKNILLNIEFLVERFSFRTLHISTHCLLTSSFWCKSINLTWDSLVCNYLSLAASRFFVWLLCVLVWVSEFNLTWSSLSFLDVSSNLGNFQPLFLQILVYLFLSLLLRGPP